MAVSLAINHVSPKTYLALVCTMMDLLGITPAHVLVELLQRRKDEKLQNHVRNKTNEMVIGEYKHIRCS